MLEKVGGRKFILAFLSLVIGSLLQWFGKLDSGGSSYIFIVGLVIGAYTMGNVSQKRIEHESPSSPSSPGSGSGAAG